MNINTDDTIETRIYWATRYKTNMKIDRSLWDLTSNEISREALRETWNSINDFLMKYECY